MSASTNTGVADAVSRLVEATNAHDLDALVACFAADYTNETPAHPERSFTGQGQVRRNWSQLFAAVPDVTAEVVRAAVDGDTMWTEWELRGTRRDGAAHLMRGVMIFTATAGLLSSVRFYLEPVERAGDDVDAAIARLVGAPQGAAVQEATS